IAWVVLNAFALAGRWDPYPFILLNLAFSLQAAYAAPLILLAQTRQADRDKTMEERSEQHHEEQVRYGEERVAAIKAETDRLTGLLESNTALTREDKELTEQVAELTREIHALLIRGWAASGGADSFRYLNRCSQPQPLRRFSARIKLPPNERPSSRRD